MICAVAGEYGYDVQRRFDGDFLASVEGLSGMEVDPSRFFAAWQVDGAGACREVGDRRYQQVRTEQVFVGYVRGLFVLGKSKNSPRTIGWPSLWADANSSLVYGLMVSRMVMYLTIRFSMVSP